MNRLLQVARLQVPAWTWMAGWPWGVMAATFGINVVIFTAIQSQIDGDTTTGALLSLYGTAIGMAAVSVTQVFPYALGMSVTRREFYLTWSLLAVAQSVGYALVLTGLHAVEQATGHWGVGLRFFGPPFLDGVDPALLVLAYAAPMLLATHLGILFGAVHLRWGTVGVFAALGLGVVGSGLAAAVITWTRHWREIGGWLADQPATALAAGLPLLLAAAAALGGFAVIRRVAA